MNMYKKVKKLTEKYKTNDPFELAKELGIEVLSETCNSAGYYFFNEGEKGIFINPNLHIKKQKVVCANELGRALLENQKKGVFIRSFTVSGTKKFQIYSNEFCAYLLLTDEMMKDFEGCSCEEISKITSIPIEIVKLRQAIKE